MVGPSTSALDKPRPSPDSENDSEDDDFVPEAEASRAPAARPKVARPAAVARDTDANTDDEDSGAEEEAVIEAGGAGEEIDADELEALKRERAELVAAAGGEDRLGKRRRLAQSGAIEPVETVVLDDEAAALKAKALAEWEAIKESNSARPTTAGAEATASSSSKGDAPNMQSDSASASLAQADEMISIPTTYKFAGEVQTSTRLLPRSHPEAIKYLASQTAASGTTASPASTASNTAAATTKPSRPPPPGPRRKKGSSLASLSAAITAKPTKLNTLEKSKLDWDSFKGDTAKMSKQELDELENQTKGGGKGLGDMKGYLERRDFLDRVKDRTGQP
ncbi:BCNT-C domain protein [Kalmanozyma brasiliensis GHG001]|uniref:SWR1-complex protein 5 n=1 Tax=Kalmanozyma brasiliensis (strain GHG001) TaxID=1365824 RepID=V5F1S8_KALBG|nr:BCNT-C domain protein [Kalmanozyma brasiliensis GHG001]EST09289.1 BCNT-C domain protein [Kalmanozyma brasiliensis GHG001]